MIVLVITLACGFVGEVSAPQGPLGSDVVLGLQAEPELEQPPAEPVWRNLGPGGGGWIQSICASPQRSGELLVGCDVGGFYRSTDDGASYTITNTGLEDYFVECIVPDPVHLDVIYLGCQSGVYKSADRGQSWQWLRQGFPPKNLYEWSAPIGALALDPQNPAVLYAGIGRPRQRLFGKGAIYKTTDSGGHWKQVNTPGSLPADALVADLVIDPRDSRRLFLACQYGVYRSDNGGVNWVPAITGLPHPYVRRIALCRNQPDILNLTLWATPSRQPRWPASARRSSTRWRLVPVGRRSPRAAAPRRCGRHSTSSGARRGTPSITPGRSKTARRASSNRWCRDGSLPFDRLRVSGKGRGNQTVIG